MEVILIEDVYNQGVAGEVVDVKPGFARNYLIPQGLAVRVTKGTLKQMEVLRKQADQRREEREEQMAEVARQIQDLVLHFPVRASEQGTLYGSVTSMQIADAIIEQIGQDIDRRRVGDEPIRALGEYDVAVRLDAGQSTRVKVIVYREGEEPPAVGEMAEIEVAEAEEPGVDLTELSDVEYAELVSEAGEEAVDAGLVEEVLDEETAEAVIEDEAEEISEEADEEEE